MNYEGTELITALNEALAHKRGEIVFPSKTLSNDGLIDRAEILKHRCKVAVEAFENYDDLPNCDYAYVVPVKYILEAEKVEPKTGYWIKNWCDNNMIGHEYEECSECGCSMLDTNQFWDSAYCPNCGARMIRMIIKKAAADENY